MSSADRLYRHEPFLALLATASRKQVEHLLKSASKDQIEALCEIAQNILQQNVSLTPNEINNLRRNKKTVYMLADRQTPWTVKRGRLVSQQQRGGFPPLLALLAPIIGGALGAVTEKVVRSQLNK